MRIADYDVVVRKSDQYADLPKAQRLEIAIYGVASEIGSLVSAVKKERLQEGGSSGVRRARRDVAEEIGDIIWYCFSLAQIENDNKPVDILAMDIRALEQELTTSSESTKLFRQALTAGNLSVFLEGAREFPRLRERTFDDYQALAFKTARTENDVLLRVCLSVLWQLGAELMRTQLPDSERTINRTLPDRAVNRILGEIAWHLSATAKLYDLSLDDVVAQNVEKTQFRTNRANPTPLHDLTCETDEQLPRQFEIQVLSVGPDRSRMYYRGQQLGDDLTDNNYDGDGYRFHDVLHLANVAKLGWSPVFRGMVERKRRRDKKVDEVEDGARARIVEEAVLKILHSEGKSIALANGEDPIVAELFPKRSDISFGVLKFIRGLIEGLEVSDNKFWEWEDAIYEGYRLYNALRYHKQGTVAVDMEKRSIGFSPHVAVDLKGVVAGMGTELVDQTEGATFRGLVLDTYLDDAERASLAHAPFGWSKASLVAAKSAMLESLTLDRSGTTLFGEFSVTPMENGRLSVKAAGRVSRAMMDQMVITFRTSVTEVQNRVSCSVLAISDPNKKR